VAVNKVEINGVVKLDLTADTVTAAKLAQGETAHDASGELITGTMTVPQLQIVVTVSAGATVTATKGNLSVSGTSVNGTCTLIVPEAGDWTVSATLGEETSNSAIVHVGFSYNTSLLFIPKLNDCTWETIRDISDAGQGANYWSIGDRKAVTLNGTVGALTLSNVTTYVFIIGFNHNSSVEGTNRIHFQLGKTALSGGTDVALCDYYYKGTDGGFQMRTNQSSSGGWASSNMRKAICGTNLSSYSGTIIAVIPAALRAVLKSVTKYTDNTGYTGNDSAVGDVTATTDYFFLLSEYEVFGTISRGNTYESKKQAQYSYYSAGNSKVKYKHSETSTAVYWWLRSPVVTYSGSFTNVYTGGTLGSFSANYSLGFAPGFCV
jgi:hypothetical protein